MPSIKESNALAALAGVLEHFLPGSGNASWRGHVSFSTVAAKLGLGAYWQQGTKLRAVTSLLERTLDHRRGDFERLVLEVVRAGIVYRQKKGDPLAPEEIHAVNGHLLELGVKYPDLWDPDLLTSLSMDNAQRAKARVEAALNEERTRSSVQTSRATHLQALQQELFALHALSNRQEAGLALERLLNKLFALEGLAPRDAFRVTGEQIDGAFELDHESYLVEAKWEKDSLCEAPLLVFRGKVEGKSQFSRGLFLALNGITDGATRAIVTGKQPNFFVITGHDLAMVLGRDIELLPFLRQRRRLFCEEGRVVVPYSALWDR